MKWTQVIVVAALLLAILTPDAVLAKKKKKSKKSDDKLFDSKTLKCLVCKNLVDEFKTAIFKVDPKKMIDTGTFRINGDGEQKRSIIPFARSQVHLMELVDKICDSFSDYAQAKTKATGEPTIIRLTTPEGNMNPNFSKVDIVPDDDLNKNLKFHCQSIVEATEDDFTDLLADEANDETLKEEICVRRAKLCKNVRDEL